MKTALVLTSAILLSPAAWSSARIEPRDSQSRSSFSLLPKSFQRSPHLEFNVMTELTPAGHKVERPTEQKPAYYVLEIGPAEAHGLIPDDIAKSAPKPDQIGRLVSQALRANHYLPYGEGGPLPTLVVFVHWGSYSNPAVNTDTLLDEQPVGNARELLPFVLKDIAKRKALIDRAQLLGGDAFARELNEVLNKEASLRRSTDSADTARLAALAGDSTTADDPGSMALSLVEASSPLALFMRRDQRNEDLVEEIFSDSYYVVVSAIGYRSADLKKPLLLWRTKMSLNSIGVSIAETVAPLIYAGSDYLGRETEKSVLLKKSIDRNGHVEFGDAENKGYIEPEPNKTPARP